MLVSLEAKLGLMPDSYLTSAITQRPDGRDYYVINGVVEATYESASTKYILLCEGRHYNTVTAEYV
jgi:hypothetical protein